MSERLGILVGLPPGNARAALRRVRWHTLRHTVSAKLSLSRLRVFLVLVFSALFWLGLYLLFFDGFQFLSRHLVGRPLVAGLFGLFFSSLLVMLTFSTGIILYAGLFVSPEAAFLLVQPIAADRIFAFKFQEAMVFSCWGFLLLGSPMMVAYGVNAAAPPTFYLFALGYFLAYALLPGCAGSLLCLLVTRFLPQRKGEVLIGLGVVLACWAVLWAGHAWQALRGPLLSQTWLNSLVGQLHLSNLPFLPSAWMSAGLLAAGTPGGFGVALFYLLVLLANGLFAYLVAAAAFAWLYRGAYSRVQSTGPRKRRPASWLSRLVHAGLAPLPHVVRVLVVKDLRTFLRDPVQWTQLLIFLGLFGLYFLNLGRMTYYSESPYWRNLIGFFNLTVIGLLMSAFTSRFIFPLMSLEGQKLWILGLCPISRATVLWSKFAYACTGAVFVTVSLTLFSAFVLKLDPLLVVVQVVTVLILCFGVSGISAGLGARFPELREPDPSKIAAGFGGTLNLVASMLFILLVITTMALPCHLYSITLAMQQGTASIDFAGLDAAGLSLAQFRFWITVSIVCSLGIGGLAVWWPMRLGIRAFEEMEY